MATRDDGLTSRAGDDAGLAPTRLVDAAAVETSLHETCLIITTTLRVFSQDGRTPRGAPGLPGEHYVRCLRPLIPLHRVGKLTLNSGS